MNSITISTEKLLKVFYLINKRIAITSGVHTTAKYLVLNAVKILLSKSDYQKLESILLSNSTVSCCIDDMEMYYKSKLCSRLQ